MDIDYVRQMIINQERFRNVDDQYTFYYDETNNIRKLYLTDSGLNVQQDNSFVLAGVAHVGEFNNKRFEPLFNSLLLQKSAKELKLKHIAKGGPFDMLKSSKLKKIFDWLNENEFYIHYFNLNLLYWSVVDIIDSIIGEIRERAFILSHFQLKGDFYDLAVSDRQVFLSQLSAFNYPDIDEAEVKDFCRWLILFVKERSGNLPTYRAEVLKSLFERALQLDELPFISGFHGKELIDNFMVFYLQKLYIFKNSRHVFDEEEQIQSLFKGFSLAENGKPYKNHEFVKSHDYLGVQLSDVIAGFLGKYFTYIKDTSSEQLISDIASLTDMQRQCFQSLLLLIDRSDARSRAFFTFVNSDVERQKHQYLCQATVKWGG
ncbi:DUF3800 domain-containing protein [Alteromonas sp. D210916BOD_24]|uniref:DUF3800 domain-containing protein n=1 Tax=Alteromonas sp. D210916BOD_24 TaxID=3157618 RepID=UPI00399CA814